MSQFSQTENLLNNNFTASKYTTVVQIKKNLLIVVAISNSDPLKGHVMHIVAMFKGL